jgi:hypothetical protein
MARLTAEKPVLHPDCEISDSTFGRFVEIGIGSRLNNVVFDDYSLWFHDLGKLMASTFYLGHHYNE